MQRYFSKQTIDVNEQIQLEKDDNHHIVRVMRGKIDDEVIIVDSTNIDYKETIETIEDNAANLGNKISNRIERLERISKEAAEQCHRNVIPEISHLSTIDTLQKEAGNYKHKLIAYEETAKKGQHGQLKETLKEVQAGDNLIIVFG